jgi:LacI family transcriptional regulator
VPRSLEKRVTIQDVARLAEVSVATVSAVINENIRVSPKREQRVREAMAALSYRPDERGRMLRTGRSRLIGVVVPDITNPFYPEILRAVEVVASAKGYGVLLSDSANDARQERAHLDALVNRGVDGVLVACVSSTTTYDWLSDQKFPLVFFERLPVAGRFVAVSTNHREAAVQATRHFQSLKHRRIGFVMTDATLSSNAARMEGYRQALAEHGMAEPQKLLVSGVKGAAEAHELGLRLLKEHRRPTAMLFSNSVLLLGFVRAARDLGLQCPKDLSVICFDNPSWTDYYPPSITTLAQPIGDIAQKAVGLLLQRIDQPTELLESRIEWLSDRLTRRESTGPAPKA